MVHLVAEGVRGITVILVLPLGMPLGLVFSLFKYRQALWMFSSVWTYRFYNLLEFMFGHWWTFVTLKVVPDCWALSLWLYGFILFPFYRLVHNVLFSVCYVLVSVWTVITYLIAFISGILWSWILVTIKTLLTPVSWVIQGLTALFD
jgi:hypothetical protein